MTKILYVQPSAEVGGSDIALWRMLRTLDTGRFPAVVVCPRPGPLTELMQQAGAGVRFVPMQQLRPLLDPRYQARYLAHFWPTVRRVAQVIREEQIDVVHTNSLFALYGAWAARVTHRPHVWHVREILPPRHPARLALTTMALRLSTHVIAMSGAVAAMFPQECWATGRVTILGDGVDTAEYHPAVSGARVRGELGIGPQTPLIGFVARLDPWKGLDVFLRAAALVHTRFPTAHFLISGDAPAGFEHHARKMRELAAALRIGEQTVFSGWRYRLRDIPEVMAALDVFVHCSTAPEPWGLVVLEAMAAGTPVVAANAGGPAEMIVPGANGWLGDRGNAQSFANAICALLDNPRQAAEIGRAGRQRVLDCYDLTRYVRALERLYQDVAQDGLKRVR